MEMYFHIKINLHPKALAISAASFLLKIYFIIFNRALIALIQSKVYNFSENGIGQWKVMKIVIIKEHYAMAFKSALFINEKFFSKIIILAIVL
jgi:hypothetical protein